MSHGPESAFTKWLKKYRYVNIALIYLGTALVVIHFAEAVVHGLHMPDITFSLIVVLALAGLPIVLLIAWATGHRKDESNEDVSIVKPVKRNWFKILAASVVSLLLFATAIFAYNKFFYHSKFTGKEKSIAVLPFINMSSDRENEYFSDGMTEEITTQLSKIADLKVIARASTTLFKDSKKSIRQIADELGVSAILEGSVQKSGDAIRITAQLIDANSQEHIWAEKYDRDFKDVFAIQSEVAQEIAYQLNAKLTKDEKKTIEKNPTNNPEAYQYYLQASHIHQKFFETYKVEYYTTSKMLLEKALSLDSNYALAHAALADLYNTYTWLSPKKDSAILKLQIKEIEKAFSIDSTLDYVNLTKGYILHSILNNPIKAHKSFRRALEINPNNPNNLYGAAMITGFFGLNDESVALMNKAIKLDPLTASNFTFRSINEISLNQLAEAAQDCQTSLHLEPDQASLYSDLTYIYSLLNNIEEAGRWLNKYLSQIPAGQNLDTKIGYYYAKLGAKKKALELKPDMRVYLALNMKEEALKNLFESEATKIFFNDYLYFYNHLQHKDFDLIRNDPRFIRLLEKKRIRYEENKQRFSIAGTLKKPSSSAP